MSALALSVLSLVVGVDLGARGPEVTGELVCRVKDAFSSQHYLSRRHRHAWTVRRCERVAATLRETDDPAELFAVCINESDLRERASRQADPQKVDAGLCGVRCVEDGYGRCANGAVRGLLLSDLYDPVKNVRVAARILRSKGSTSGYAGETVDRGYASRISVLVSALGGELVPVSGRGPRSRRLRDHASRIVRAVMGATRS